jgi:hypothetical protein
MIATIALFCLLDEKLARRFLPHFPVKKPDRSIPAICRFFPQMPHDNFGP